MARPPEGMGGWVTISGTDGRKRTDAAVLVAGAFADLGQPPVASGFDVLKTPTVMTRYRQAQGQYNQGIRSGWWRGGVDPTVVASEIAANGEELTEAQWGSFLASLICRPEEQRRI